MSIWHSEPSLEAIHELCLNTIHDPLGIEVVEIGNDYLLGKMPVSRNTRQPYGILHGGASVVLAESLGSIAGNLVVDSSKFGVVGVDVNANHLNMATNGFVYAKAFPIKLGNKIQVWSIEIKDESAKMICVSRLTLAVISISDIRKK